MVPEIRKALTILVWSAVGVALFVVASNYFPVWKNINWGSLQLSPAYTITVTGEAKTQIKNQLASFSAGVSTVNDNKDTAVSEVNKKTQEIIDAAKTFGIPTEDIQTQNLSIYQNDEYYYDDQGKQKSRPGQWRVSNNIEIKLRKVDRASELADLLTGSGATNVYGPNLTIDDTGEADRDLLDKAILDAREKAGRMAQSAGKRLGDTISITEGATSQPFPMFALRGDTGGGGGAPVESGTGTVAKFVTVTFELK